MKKLIGLLAFAAFSITTVVAQDKAQMEKDDALLQKYFADNKIKPSKTASGIYYVVSQKGSGPNAKAGQTVSVFYTGKLMNGNIFDSNMGKSPINFPLGAHRVIAGWDEGIALLNKGEKATLYIPSQLAYGNNSPDPVRIPANSIMVFDVELVDAK